MHKQNSGSSGGPTPAGAAPRTQVIPQTNLDGAGPQPQARLVIREASGRSQSSLQYSAATMAGRVQLYEFMPTINPSLSAQAAPGNAVVAGIPFYWGVLFNQLIAQMARDRYPINQGAYNVTQIQLIKALTDMGSVYGGLRALQSILNSPAYNTPLGTMIQTVQAQQVTIKGLFDQFNGICMPSLYREIIDCSVGVFCPEPTGPTIVVVPANGTYAGGTMVDVSSAASLTTYLTNIEATIQGIVGTPASAQVANIFGTAFGTHVIATKGVNTDQRCYDMWLTKCWSIVDSTSHNLWAAPSLPLDSSNRVPLLVRRNTWKDGDLVADLYSSLLRATPVAQNNNVANASAEVLGLFNDTISTTGASLVEWFPANNSIGTIVTGNQAVTAGVTLTDPVSWEFAWAAIAAFETTTYANLRNPMPDFEIIEENVTSMADNSSELLNQIMATGYLGSSFTPARMS